MDSDEGKLFIGGVAWDTTEEKLKEHFTQYGDVSETVIMRDKTTGRPRGFAFLVFSDPSVIERVLQDKHTIDGRMVEVKRALSREEQHSSSRIGNLNSGKSSGEGGNFRTKKIFVGGLPPTLTEDRFKEYFESYGCVVDVVMMYDQNTQRPRGFGFITFDSEDAVDRVLQKTFHDLDSKLVEVKRALPKDAYSGGGGRAGGYQGYGSSGTNRNSFDSYRDNNRYLQPQTNTGGFPPYSGYIAASYGYGAANSALGYGGFGPYGIGSYGTTGFGGPAAFGNQNAGYMSVPPVSLKNNWSSQNPSGYGANAGYGYTAPWSTPRGQSPGGSSGHRNQGYGYGSHGGRDSPYYGGNVSSSNVSGGVSGERQAPDSDGKWV